MEHLRTFPDLDPRPLYPETVAVGVSRPMRAALMRAARAEHVPMSTIVRRAIERALAGHPARQEA